MKKKLKSVAKGYRLFKATGEAYNAPRGPIQYLLYGRLRKKLRGGEFTRENFFAERLYDKAQWREEYFENFYGYVRSWKFATRKFVPGAGRFQRFLYGCDYLISRKIYFGLDANDYFAYEFYNMRHAKRKTFVTEGFIWKVDRILNKSPESMPSFKLLDNKVETNRYFSRFIQRKWIASESMTREEFESFCQGLKEVIVKPLGKSGGHGLYKVSIETPEARNKLYEEEQGKGSIIEEVIVQHAKLAELNPNSVNTYRIFSFNDGNNKITICGAALRMGGGTDCADNFHRGGYAASVDVETGIVVSRAVNSAGGAALLHPYTHVQIIGMNLPEWKKAVDMVTEAHKMLPKAGHIGWDVAVCEDSSVTIVEANVYGDIALLQRPLLMGVKPLYDALIQEWKEKRNTEASQDIQQG